MNYELLYHWLIMSILNTMAGVFPLHSQMSIEKCWYETIYTVKRQAYIKSQMLLFNYH